MGCDFGTEIPTPELAYNTLHINVIGTINLTDAMKPFIKDNGRVINVSSKLAALRFQGKSVVEKYDRDDLTVEEIYKSID